MKARTFCIVMGLANMALAGYGLHRHHEISQQEADPTFGHHNMFLVEGSHPYFTTHLVGTYAKADCAWCNKESGVYPPSIARRNRELHSQAHPAKGIPGEVGPGRRFATEAERQDAIKGQVRAILGRDPSES